jgi:secondary thiamine-phosphate synthase enzyme
VGVVRQVVHRVTIATRGQNLVMVTERVASWLQTTGITTGLLTVFCRHTSASLLIQENADPTVRQDLDAFFRRLVLEGNFYRHDAEGPDDMPAHIKAALTQTQLSIPVQDGRMVLGTWQGIYLWEHRAIPHRRELALHVIGD